MAARVAEHARIYPDNSAKRPGFKLGRNLGIERRSHEDALGTGVFEQFGRAV